MRVPALLLLPRVGPRGEPMPPGLIQPPTPRRARIEDGCLEHRVHIRASITLARRCAWKQLCTASGEFRRISRHLRVGFGRTRAVAARHLAFGQHRAQHRRCQPIARRGGAQLAGQARELGKQFPRWGVGRHCGRSGAGRDVAALLVRLRAVGAGTRSHRRHAQKSARRGNWERGLGSRLRRVHAFPQPQTLFGGLRSDAFQLRGAAFRAPQSRGAFEHRGERRRAWRGFQHRPAHRHHGSALIPASSHDFSD
mmetsp:Transcript_84843/g.274233  ORF Transcript_84843/g.274233 Transcript_84843/m.274233 type:complete len:253 (+) Transcript_84843:780-1538(+)